MKKYIWALWVALPVAVLASAVAALALLAAQPTEPGATSPVPAKLQLVAAVVAPLGAVFTTVGVGVALFVAIRDSRRFAHEERQRRREDTERRADQARLIQVFPDARRDMPPGTIRCDLKVHNHSTAPILDVTHEMPTRLDNLIVPSEPVERRGLVKLTKPVLKPGDTWEWSFDCDNPDVYMDAINSISISFTDAAGVRWVRVWNQQPVLADSTDANSA